MNRRRVLVILLAALALGGCTDIASTQGRFGYDKNGYGPYGYGENYSRCGWGGPCDSDYGSGHGIGLAGPPVDQP